MRYIDKSKPFQAWIDFVEEHKGRLRNDWGKLKKMDSVGGRKMREKLHNYLLAEQNGLCIYCEQEIFRKQQGKADSFDHIEHLKPKIHFKELTFVYENLAVSCDGFELKANAENPKKKEFCGHKKNNDFDESQFLNPVLIEDLAKYFQYDIEGGISPSSTLSNDRKNKAQYMIELLNLNHLDLKNMRKTAYADLIELEISGVIANEFLDPRYASYPAFFSMLNYMCGIDSSTLG